MLKGYLVSAYTNFKNLTFQYEVEECVLDLIGLVVDIWSDSDGAAATFTLPHEESNGEK